MSSAAADSSPHRFPQSMVFQKTWRAYQKRILDQLESYLDDKHLHLVAAPGSGKTVLGLEVIRRIGQPALVLAPTITIRDQWADRVVEHFLPAGSERPDWVSTDIRKPALLTIATYQSLHSICLAEPESEQTAAAAEEGEEHNGKEDENGNGAGQMLLHFPDALSRANFKTLLVDEAHHLRAEWWKTLTFVADHLENATIVALTATPPYDVSPAEWQRYEQLCGPVDEEVSVPELVLAGDLCPHQDYVYFSTPEEKEQRVLFQFRSAVDEFVRRVRSTQEFKAALLIHPWMLIPGSHVEEILDNPQYLSSMIIYLKACGEVISDELLKLLGLSQERIPAWDLEWMEILLSNCLYSDGRNFKAIEGVCKSFRRELLDIGAVEHRQVKLRHPSQHARLLTTSVTKLKSIEEIVRLESAAMSVNLRCVVLTDFIRPGEMPSPDGEAVDFEDIGVVPIFETLRRAKLKRIELGVLSGSMVLIPGKAEPVLRAAAEALGVRADDLSLTPLRHDPDFFQVELRGEYLQGTVRLITSIFEQGAVNVLVGTKSLLGEGWDAPCINTLVLASFVGSFVLSNQMRGRSIRVDTHHPGKTANIWHLVCLEPGVCGPGEDFALLERRCRGFVGVSLSELGIGSGTRRLGFGVPPFTAAQVTEINANTSKMATDRAALRQRWQDALAAGANQGVRAGLRASRDAGPRSFLLRSTVPALAVQTGSAFLTAFFEVMRQLASGAGTTQQFFASGTIAAGAAAVITLPWGLRAAWIYARHASPRKSIRQIGRAVLESLIYEGTIHPGPDQSGVPAVFAENHFDGTVLCWINGKGYEQAAFQRALSEVMGPVDDARFLLTRRRGLREDYFVVPMVLARKKESAEFFARRWERLVGPAELVYTRTPEGRQVLLRARVHSLASAFQKRSERISCWK